MPAKPPTNPAPAPPQGPAITVRAPARSMGLKLLLVCALALLMSIPALFVFAVLMDRTSRAERVTAELSELVGGPQTFLGPVLAIPYNIPARAAANGEEQRGPENGVYVVFPKTGAGTATLDTGVKRRGLFKAVTYSADVVLTGQFDLATAGSAAPRGATLDWTRAELLVGASDARGAQSDITLSMGENKIQMVPAQALSSMELAAEQRSAIPNNSMPSGDFKFFGSGVDGLKVGDTFEATATMKFSGAQRLALLPFAETTTFKATGDWPAPSYDGGFLPVSHNEAGDKDGQETKDGAPKGTFSADWSVPYIARGVVNEGTSDVISRLGPASLGVSLIETANPYQAVQRSLKYAVMFVGLVFLTYFLFETTQKKRIHPAQYVLIGLAQVIFYLLLLSIAERVGFDIGFAISAAATVGLISAYAGWVFNSKKQGYVALIAFAVLYLLIYILMRLEDWALLVGAVAAFAAIAAVMYFTRNIDWYGNDKDVKEGA